MSLQYAADHLIDAVRSLAASERPLPERLQSAWDEHIEKLWQQPCLTGDLLREFRDLWFRYTAQSDDPRNTKLRNLTGPELVQAVGDVVALSVRTSVAAANATGDEKLATLADLA